MNEEQGGQARLDELGERVVSLESAVGEMPSFYVVERLGERLERLDERLGRLERGLYEYVREDDLNSLRSDVDDLRRKLDTLKRDTEYQRGW